MASGPGVPATPTGRTAAPRACPDPERSWKSGYPAVEQFTRDSESLFNVGDAAGMAACYAEDAKLLAENIELIQGRMAIEQFWRHAIERARAANAARTINLGEVTSSGDLGYALGTVVVQIPHRPGSTTKYATIWQRDPDGRWRLAVDSSSPNPLHSP